MQNTAREVRTNPQASFFNEPFHTDVLVLDDQLEPIYNTSVLTLDIV